MLKRFRRGAKEKGAEGSTGHEGVEAKKGGMGVAPPPPVITGQAEAVPEVVSPPKPLLHIVVEEEEGKGAWQGVANDSASTTPLGDPASDRLAQMGLSERLNVVEALEDFHKRILAQAAQLEAYERIIAELRPREMSTGFWDAETAAALGMEGEGSEEGDQPAEALSVSAAAAKVTGQIIMVRSCCRISGL
jgi:hypothetical protein